MDQVANALLPLLRMAMVAIFVLLAVVAVARAPRSGSAGWWVAAAFGLMALTLVEGIVGDSVTIASGSWLPRVMLLTLLAFPYLLLRFTASFRPLPRWVEYVAGLGVAASVVLTLVIPAVPDARGVRLEPSQTYIAVVLLYWTVVSAVTVVRLWRAGRGQPSVPRRSMRLMSTATAVLAVALLLAGTARGSDSIRAGVLFAALISGLTFGLGFAPPGWVRLAWRRVENERLQVGTMAVLRAQSVEEIADQLLPPMASIVGGNGAALVDSVGTVVAGHGKAPPAGTPLDAWDARTHGRSPEIVTLDQGRGSIAVWVSPYTPFFGRDEIELLRTMAAVASLALERLDLLADERAARAVLEDARREADGAREEASRANAAKTEFLSRMSHELRTPLNAVLGFGQLLELASLSTEDREAVEHILKAGRHLLALINDVLDLSRIEAGTMAVSLEPVQAASLIEDTVPLIQPLASSRSIQVISHTSDCDAHVMTDRQRCRQILLNLLSNAVKYNRDGGQVEIDCRRVAEETLRISVRDTGPGIDPARRDRLFEPFERLGAESSGVEGTGLGLALTKQLVQRLGGTIGLATELGAGSTFWIDLPTTQPPAVTAVGDRDQRPAGAQPSTVLLVEDNLANLRLVEAMLRRRQGISVLPAMQGGLALELAHEHRPDVIVLDLHLPDLSGREILHRLKADPRTRDIPVVVASADATPGRVRQLREEGAFAYITKPLDVGQFLDVLDEALAYGTESLG